MANPWDNDPIVAAPKGVSTQPWENDAIVSPTASPQQSTGLDIAKSAGSGLAQGTMDLIGLPGTISDALNNLTGAGLHAGYRAATGAANYLQGNGYIPQEPAPGSFFAGEAVPPSFGSGHAIRADVSDLTNGASEYKPQTTPGQFAQTASSFIPGAVAFGGASPSNIIKYGVIPGLGSEAAGETADKIAPNTVAGPIARVAGAMLAPLGPAAFNKVISPMGGAISPERAALNAIMEREGIDLTAGQQTGSKALRYKESQLGGAAAQNFAERQGDQFTGAIMQRIGSNSTRATPEAIQEAGQRIGQQFDGLAARNAIVPDQQFSQDLGNTLRTYIDNTNPSMRIPVIQNTVSDLAVNAAQGPINGAKYQELSSMLGSRIRNASGEELEAYQSLHSALDDAMERSIAANNPSDLGAWQDARNQYRNLLVVEKVATAAGENARQGIISPAALRSAVTNIGGRRNFARGQGDFADLARAGEGTMAPLPDSGTASRMESLIPGGLGTATGAGLGSLFGNPMIGAALGAVVPNLAGRAALTSVGRNYLANQVMS